jgi:hypothetical protein
VGITLFSNFFISCSKENIIFDSPSKLTVVQAQKYFEEELIRINPNTGMEVRNGEDNGYQIDWNNATSYRSVNKSVDVVEANIIEAPVSISVYSFGGGYDTMNYISTIPQRRAVVTLDDNDKISMFVLKIAPTPGMSQAQNMVQGTNLDHYSSGFNGIIEFSTLLDSIYKTYSIQNGTEYLFEPSQGNSHLKVDGIQIRDIACDWVTVYTWEPCMAFTSGLCDYWIPTKKRGCFTGGLGSGYDDYIPDNNGDNPKGEGSTSNDRDYYQEIRASFADNPEGKRLITGLWRTLLDLYDLKMPVEDFWNIMGDSGDSFIYANLDWHQGNSIIMELDLFEGAFAELLFLKEINYPLDPVNNAQTEAYQWIIGHHEAFIPMNIYLNNNIDIESKEALRLHLQTMIGNEQYYSINQQKGYPQLGTAEWAETIESIYKGNDPWSLYRKLTAVEKYLCMESPRKGLIIAINTKKAGDKSRQVYAVSGRQERNSMVDAFRHTYWVALNAQTINESSVIEFYTARESETPTHLQLEKDMDMHNNYWGLQIGKDNIDATEGTLTAIILSQYMHTGVLRYLSPINYNDPCFWTCDQYEDTGTGGISSSTQLIQTHE